MRNRPLLTAALALMAGLWLGRALAPPSLPIYFALAAATVALPWALFRRSMAVRHAALGLFFLLAGMARMAAICHPDLPPNHLSRWAGEKSIRIEGEVVEAPPRAEGRRAFVLDAHKVILDRDEWTRTAGKIRIFAGAGMPAFEKNAVVRLKAAVQYVAANRTPGAYDPTWESVTRGVLLQGRATSTKRIEVVTPAPRGPRRFVEYIRERIRAAADSGPGWQPWLVRCLALGDQSRNDPIVHDAFYRAGVIHVLVIAGLHISAVAGLVYMFAWFALTRSPRLAGRLRPWRWAAAAAAPAAILYAVLAGGATSVMRACIMYLILLFSLYVGRRRDPLISLAAAAILVLLLDPGALWSPGFQFSFAAVGGIIHWRGVATSFGRFGVSKTPLPTNRWLDAVRRWFLTSLAVSLAAWLATAPFSLWHYGVLATAAPIANYAAIPLFSVAAIPFLLFGCALCFVSPAAAHLCWRVTEFAMNQVFGAVLLLDRVGLKMYTLGRPSLPEMAFYAGLFIAVPHLDRRAVRRGAAAALACLVALPIGSAWLARHKADLTLTMLDVGQGLSMLLQAPGGKTMLIDGGPDPHGHTTAAFLTARRIRRVDMIVSTHPHPDHYEGLEPVIDHFSVGEIWTIDMDRPFREMGPWLQLLGRAHERGIPVRRLSRADAPFDWNGVRIEVLNPPAETPRAWEPNDRALALRLSWRGRTLLMSADMESFAEDSLLASGRDVRADIVQVGHHGSFTSSQDNFVDAVGAAHALIPVGFQNQYRLPRADVIARWREAGAHVWRTDLDGAIECTTAGEPWRCRSIAPRPVNPLLAKGMNEAVARHATAVAETGE